MKKIILPILIITLLLASCTPKNQEFNLLVESINDFQVTVDTFISQIEEDISKGGDSFCIVELYNKNSKQFIEVVNEYNDELFLFEHQVDSELIGKASKQIGSIKTKLFQTNTLVNDYYIENVENQIANLLENYKDSDDKNTTDLLEAQELFTSLNSIIENTTFDDVRLKEQSTLLASFISCSDTYTKWLESSEEFANLSVTCETIVSSKSVVNEYLESTREHYNSNTQSLDTVSSLNRDANLNADLFLNIFEAYKHDYEAVIEDLEFIVSN